MVDASIKSMSTPAKADVVDGVTKAEADFDVNANFTKAEADFDENANFTKAEADLDENANLTKAEADLDESANFTKAEADFDENANFMKADVYLDENANFMKAEADLDENANFTKAEADLDENANFTKAEADFDENANVADMFPEVPKNRSQIEVDDSSIIRGFRRRQQQESDPKTRRGWHSLALEFANREDVKLTRADERILKEMNADCHDKPDNPIIRGFRRRQQQESDPKTRRGWHSLALEFANREDVKLTVADGRILKEMNADCHDKPEDRKSWKTREHADPSNMPWLRRNINGQGKLPSQRWKC